MSEDPEIEDIEDPEDPEDEEEDALKEAASILENVPGVGPKTAEKLASIGYDTIKKLTEADPEELAAAVPGLSVSKAIGVIDEAKALQEAIDAGVVDITGKAKKSKRKKAPEPDPEIHELPPTVVLEENIQRTTLETGLRKENVEMGITIGPKWLTRFERARIVGARALQIAMGAPVLVDMTTAPTEIFALAEIELRSGLLPMTIRRSLPTGETADIALSLLLKNTRLD